MASLASALVLRDSLLAPANGLLATEYLSASGLACVLYDYILTFYDEWVYMWKRGFWDSTRIMYFLIRYCNLAAMLYTAYVFAGLRKDMSDDSCRGFLMAVGFLGMFSIGCANAFLTLRHYALWDRRRWAKIALFVAFGVTYSAILALFILTLIRIFHDTYYDIHFRTCLVKSKPKEIIGVWGAMSTFDIITVLLALSNALDQPYRETVEVLERFRRDGAVFFIALLGLRMINLICSIVLPKDDLLVTLFFVWAMVTVTTCRLMLRVEKIRVSAMQLPSVSSPSTRALKGKDSMTNFESYEMSPPRSRGFNRAG